jgi:hypothetical protein
MTMAVKRGDLAGLNESRIDTRSIEVPLSSWRNLIFRWQPAANRIAGDVIRCWAL